MSNTKTFGVPILGIGLLVGVMAASGTVRAQEVYDPPFWDPSSQPPGPPQSSGDNGGGGSNQCFSYCFSCYNFSSCSVGCGMGCGYA